MPLSAGDRLGPYEVTGELGAGGMGIVLRAHDTQLNRDVTLKILPDAFAADPDRLARFQREAQVLASLNHPNIAQIHGIEEAKPSPLQDVGRGSSSATVKALVLELVEGPTLAECIRAGSLSPGQGERAGVRGLPLEDALPIARQIAEALEAAHEQGVIHRDLKPANVKVKADGTVKVLDFGLAKALDPTPEGDPSQSPTLTAAATQMGVIMGTASYMSPEQARGKPVDKRADIWAFGCVLYEMLTGRRAFQGEDVSLTLSAVLQQEPDWAVLSGNVPHGMNTYLRCCLQKDPRQRVQAIGDVRLAMEGAFETPLGTASMESAAAKPPGLQQAVPLKLAVAALVVAVVGTWWATRPDLPEPEPPMRLETRLGGLGADQGAVDAVLSPDGTRLAYTACDLRARESRAFGQRLVDGVLSFESGGLYVRSFDQAEATLLVSGVALSPFFSPNSQWVGFFTETEIRKVPVAGGAAQTVAAVSSGGLSGMGGSWGTDGAITYGSVASGLFRVSANGGEPEPLTHLEEGEFAHRWPQVLPGGRAVLFTSNINPFGIEAEAARIEVLDLETRERKLVQAGGALGRYVPTGHLVYWVEGNLFAVPFDLEALEVEGSAVPVATGVSEEFSFATTGTLAYLSGGGDPPEYPVVWVDRQGATTPLWEEPGAYGNPRLSPDGARLALGVHRDGNMDVWVYDIQRGVPTPLTYDDARNDDQIWSPDGQYLIFASQRDLHTSMYRVRADGSEAVEWLTDGEIAWPESWSADGRFLAFGKGGSQTLADIWVLPLDGDGESQPFANTDAVEYGAAFAPNGRWIAYASTESGILDVYVRSYPPGPGQWKVSSDGGSQPRWSADGRELFYRTDSGLMVVAVEPDADAFSWGRAQELFRGSFHGGIDGVLVGGERYWDYDVTADGQRFVMFPSENNDGENRADNVTLVLNWLEELKARVPVP